MIDGELRSAAHGRRLSDITRRLGSTTDTVELERQLTYCRGVLSPEQYAEALAPLTSLDTLSGTMLVQTVGMRDLFNMQQMGIVWPCTFSAFDAYDRKLRYAFNLGGHRLAELDFKSLLRVALVAVQPIREKALKAWIAYAEGAEDPDYRDRLVSVTLACRAVVDCFGEIARSGVAPEELAVLPWDQIDTVADAGGFGTDVYESLLSLSSSNPHAVLISWVRRRLYLSLGADYANREYYTAMVKSYVGEESRDIFTRMLQASL